MADSAIEGADLVRLALREVIAGHGTEVLSQPALLAGLLADLVPGPTRLAKLVVEAVEEGVPEALQQFVQQGMDSVTASTLAAAAFARSSLYAPELCDWVARELEAAMRLKDRADLVQPGDVVPAYEVRPATSSGSGSASFLHLASPAEPSAHVDWPTPTENVNDSRGSMTRGNASDSPASTLRVTVGRERIRPVRLAGLAGFPPLLQVEFSPDMRTVAVLRHSGNATVDLWHIANPSRPAHATVLSGRGSSVQAMAYSPSGRAMVTAAETTAPRKRRGRGNDSDLFIWHIGDRGEASISSSATVEGVVYAVSLSPDGRTMATAGSLMVLWDVEKAMQKKMASTKWISVAGAGRQEPDHHYDVIKFSPNGRMVAASEVRVNNARRQGAQFEVGFWDVSDRARPARVCTTGPLASQVTSISFLTEDQILIIADTADLWDISDLAYPPRRASRFSGDLVGNILAFSNRKLVTSAACLTSESPGDPVDAVSVWDIRNPVDLIYLGNLRRRAEYGPFALSVDGQMLATPGDFPGSLILWGIGHAT